MFVLSKAKEAWVADLWEQREGGRVWNFHFVRSPNDCELDYVERFLRQLQGHAVIREQKDKVVWKGGCKGRFSIRGLYLLLEPDCAVSSSRDYMESLGSL